MRQIALLGLVVLAIVLSACVMPGAKAPAQAPTVTEEPANVTPIQPAPKPVAPAPVPQAGSECLKAQNILQQDQCYSNLAASLRDEKYCDKIYSIATRDGCLAPFSNDEKVCEKLSASLLRQSCFYAAAMRLNDTDYCTKMGPGNKQTECLKALSPPCSFEKDNQSTMLCRALLKKDYALCTSNQCLFEYALNAGTKAPCDLISNEKALAGACKAAVTKETNYCYNLPQASIQDYCYELTAYALNDDGWCTDASEGSDYRNRCLLSFAINRSDTTKCQGAAPETSRDECYLGYAVAKNDAAVCEKVINSLNRNKCMINTAMKNGNPAACNAMQYYDKRSCYNLVVTGTVPIYSPGACAAVGDELWQGKCYLTAALQAKDSSLCSKISDDAVKSECMGRFN